MSRVYVFVAAVLEICWAIGLKYTEGFTRLVPSALTISAMALSLLLLALAVETLPIGTVYAVWTGIGAVGTVVAGIYLFGEPHSLTRLLFIGFIVAGIVGLNFTGTH